MLSRMEAFRQNISISNSPLDLTDSDDSQKSHTQSRSSSYYAGMERGGRSKYEGDAKYVSELSTVLVATIQETKDRISLIEHIFCSDLFPNIQSKWKSMYDVCSEVEKAAEDSWKEREICLLAEIEELKTENKKLNEENKELKESKMEKKRDEYIPQLIDEQRSLQQKINELEWDLKEKSVELKKAQESVDSLLNYAQRDGKRLAEYENLINEEKRTTRELVGDLERSKKETSNLQEELMKKIRDVNDAKVLREDLWTKFESQALKITTYEGILKEREDEMKLQEIRLKQFSESVNELHGELEIKSKAVDEGKKVQQQLAQQVEHRSKQLLAVEQHLKDQQCQNTKLLLKVKELEERVQKLQAALQDKMTDLERKEDSIKQLSHSIESQKCELVSERKKRIEGIEMYKKLKSQYTYLLDKSGLTPEGVLAKDKKLAEVNSVTDADIPAAFTDMKRKEQTEDATGSDDIKPKDDSRWNKHQNNEEVVRSGKASEVYARDFVKMGTSEKCNKRKAISLAGTKRPASRWRETRSHQNQDGPDPHDDFLNTPLEIIRENLNKVVAEEVCDLPNNVPLEVNLSSSDDEIQNRARVDSKRQQKQPLESSSKGYKYVEPVRKKADRDNLKGVECKQCKKFYDAVLSNDGSSEKNLRCEHHDGVTRHRYKYIPPNTPEGFWNIGFDSEK